MFLKKPGLAVPAFSLPREAGRVMPGTMSKDASVPLAFSGVAFIVVGNSKSP
jgi:hypothetical protein